MKNLTKIVMLVAITLLLVGCTKNGTESADGPNEIPEDLIEIQDEQLISDLWNSILYDAITTVGNEDGFNEASQISTETVARFAYLKVIREQGYADLGQTEDNRYIVSLDQITQKSKTYFNVTELELKNIDSYYYIEDEDGLAFYSTPEEEIPRYDQANSWGIKFEKMYLVKDNLYEARLFSYFYKNEDYIETEWIYRVEKNEDIWTFISLEKNYPDNGLVRIEGNVEIIKDLKNYTGLPGNNDLIILANDEKGRVIVSGGMVVDDKYTTILGLIDIETFTMLKYIDLGDDYLSFSSKEYKIIVKRQDIDTVYDFELKEIEQVKIPALITNLRDREIVYDEEFLYPAVWFGGYDISMDGKQICFSDEEGLKLYDINSEEVVLLGETIVFENIHSEMPISYYLEPQFIANDEKIFVGMSGYEDMYGYVICDLADNNEIHRLDIGSSLLVLHDKAGTNLVTIKDNEGVKINLRNLDTKALQAEWPLKGEFDQRYMPLQNKADQFTFISYDYENDSTLIYQIDLNENTINGPIASVNYGDVTILGVLEDDRVLCSYNLYLNESGYFIITP